MSQDNVKIYHSADSGQNPVVSDAERAAEEYRLQNENGNLKKAHQLGAEVTDCFLGMEVGREFAPQEWVLLSYLAQNLLEQGLENPILQKSAQARFNEELEKSSPELAQVIHDSKAFTLYSLNETRLRSRSEGEIFAELCERPGDQKLIQMGEKLALEFTNKVETILRGISFLQ